MAEGRFSIRFEGGDAAYHQLDLKLLGRSLVGIERIVSDTAFVAIEGRLPKQRERLPIQLRADAATAHCFDISGIIAAAPGVLPFAHEATVAYGADLVGKSLGFVLSKFGGRANQSETNFRQLMELTDQIREDYRAVGDAERSHSLAVADRLLALVDRLHNAARETVAPIGPSCDQLTLPSSAGPATVIDVPMADAIRATEPLEVGDMVRMVARVDGVFLTRRTLKVELVDEKPGTLIDADVRDPAFDHAPNIYTEALDGRSIALDCKPTYRQSTGELIKLHVMNAVLTT